MALSGTANYPIVVDLQTCNSTGSSGSPTAKAGAAALAGLRCVLNLVPCRQMAETAVVRCGRNCYCVHVAGRSAVGRLVVVRCLESLVRGPLVSRLEAWMLLVDLDGS